jgi:hypothetical protein
MNPPSPSNHSDKFKFASTSTSADHDTTKPSAKHEDLLLQQYMITILLMEDSNKTSPCITNWIDKTSNLSAHIPYSSTTNRIRAKHRHTIQIATKISPEEQEWWNIWSQQCRTQLSLQTVTIQKLRWQSPNHHYHNRWSQIEPPSITWYGIETFIILKLSY